MPELTAADIEDDFDIYDGQEVVSYQHRTLTGGSTTYEGVHALKRATRGQLMPVGGGGTQTSIDTSRWHIKASTLAVLPRRGDRIVSLTSGTWEVLSDDIQTLATRYALETQKVA